MLNQLLQIMTPELIIQAIKANPKVIIDTLQKFDTFKLLGQSLTMEQQVVLSNNTALMNGFLASQEGKTAVGIWAEEFTYYVKNFNTKKAISSAEALEAETDRIKTEETTKAREAMEAQIRTEMAGKIKADIEAEARAEITKKVRDEIAKAVREEELLRIDIENKIKKELEYSKKSKVPLPKINENFEK